MDDILYNILLQSDVKTINQLCKTNKKANTICNNNKQFWIDKFSQDYLEPLLIDFEPDDYSYLEWYNVGIQAIENTKNILKINYIEYNRKYNKTNGVFIVLVGSMHTKILNYWFPNLKDLEYNELKFNLNNNNYSLTITYDMKNNIDLGKYTIHQVEKMLPSLLFITEICSDEHGFSMIYRDDKKIYNYQIDQNPIHAKVLLIRRGMWEIIEL